MKSGACGNRRWDFATDINRIAENLEQNLVPKTQRARESAQGHVPPKLQASAEALEIMMCVQLQRQRQRKSYIRLVKKKLHSRKESWIYCYIEHSFLL